MKIRNGFVSNSSTSSFMIYGLRLDRDIIRKLIQKNVKDAGLTYISEIRERKQACKCYYTKYNSDIDFCPKCGKKVIITTIKKENEIDLEEFSDDLKKAIGISIQLSYHYEGIGYIGKIIRTDSEPEDLIKIKEILAKMFPDNKCSFHTETSNN